MVTISKKFEEPSLIALGDLEWNDPNMKIRKTMQNKTNPCFL